MIATPNLRLKPISRRGLGFDYDPNWLPRKVGVSDSGGRWSQPFDELVAGFPYDGQVHMLVHPDWWSEASAPKGRLDAYGLPVRLVERASCKCGRAEAPRQRNRGTRLLRWAFAP
jgi:hypothetical protein